MIQFETPLEIDVAVATVNIDVDSDGTTDIPTGRGYVRVELPRGELSLPPLTGTRAINLSIKDQPPSGSPSYDNDLITFHAGRFRAGMDGSNDGAIYIWPTYFSAANNLGWSMGFQDVNFFVNWETLVIEDGTGSNGSIDLSNLNFSGTTLNGILNFYTYTMSVPAHSEVLFQGGTGFSWLSYSAQNKTLISMDTPGFSGIDILGDITFDPDNLSAASTRAIGDFTIDGLALSNMHLYVTGGKSQNGTAAAPRLEFELGAELKIESLEYNPGAGGSDELIFEDVQMAGRFTGAATSPGADGWSVNNTYPTFNIGRMDATANHRPAQIDLGTDGGTTIMIANLILDGSIRIKSTSLRGTNFGPVAIDQIDVYYLGLKILKGAFP